MILKKLGRLYLPVRLFYIVEVFNMKIWFYLLKGDLFLLRLDVMRYFIIEAKYEKCFCIIHTEC